MLGDNDSQIHSHEMDFSALGKVFAGGNNPASVRAGDSTPQQELMRGLIVSRARSKVKKCATQKTRTHTGRAAHLFQPSHDELAQGQIRRADARSNRPPQRTVLFEDVLNCFEAARIGLEFVHRYRQLRRAGARCVKC